MISFQTRIVMRRLALDDLKAEHAELWDSWKVVEAKAQPIAALAGVFLAGIFAYLTQLPKAASDLERVLLLCIAVTLVFSALCALQAIWVVEVNSPYLSSEHINEIDDLLRVSGDENELDARHERLLQAATDRWSNACAAMRLSLRTKQNWLTACLWLLCTAASACLPLAVFAVFARGAGTL